MQKEEKDSVECLRYFLLFSSSPESIPRHVVMRRGGLLSLHPCNLGAGLGRGTHSDSAALFSVKAQLNVQGIRDFFYLSSDSQQMCCLGPSTSYIYRIYYILRKHNISYIPHLHVISNISYITALRFLIYLYYLYCCSSSSLQRHRSLTNVRTIGVASPA